MGDARLPNGSVDRTMNLKTQGLLETWVPAFTIEQNARHLGITYSYANNLVKSHGLGFKRVARTANTEDMAKKEL